MILMTHPTACLGQPTLHGAVIVMTPRHDDSVDSEGYEHSRGDEQDSLIGVVVNKPLVLPPKQPQNDDDGMLGPKESAEGAACVLGDLLPEESKQKLKRYGLARNSGHEKKKLHEA